MIDKDMSNYNAEGNRITSMLQWCASVLLCSPCDDFLSVQRPGRC